VVFVNVDNGVRLHVQDVGSGPAVILLSGFGLNHQLWDRQVRVLADAGYRTVCITQRGHGQSDQPLSGYGLDRMSADAAAVLDSMGVTGATVVGHSFGGQVSFLLAANRPDLVSRLVLVGSNAVRASRSDDFPFGAPPEPVLSQLVAGEESDRVSARYPQIEMNFATPPHPGTVNWLMSAWLHMPSWSAIACYRTMLTADLISDIPRVSQPVLQIVGSADRVHSAKGAHWLQSRLSDAVLTELDCGHFPMLEVGEDFDEALLRFLP
jgi:pimeloyl-ACP methyl ester carboxylesterase